MQTSLIFSRSGVSGARGAGTSTSPKSHAIGSDTQRPFAIVIIGGLISSTLLTMLLLPTLYELADRWFGAGRRQRRRLREMEEGS